MSTISVVLVLSSDLEPLSGFLASNRTLGRVLKPRGHSGVSGAPFLKPSDDLRIYIGRHEQRRTIPDIGTGNISVICRSSIVALRQSIDVLPLEMILEVLVQPCR